MSSKHRQIRVQGKQCEPIDTDLLAQIVLMLGRQLADEAAAENATSRSPNDSQAGTNGIEETCA